MAEAFNGAGPLALDPRAIGMLFDLPTPLALELRGEAAVLSVVGPLHHHPVVLFPSYDGAKAAIRTALDAGARVIVMAIDSPGGTVSGCFDSALEIRAMVDAAGARLISYVDGLSASGGYALACAGHEIVIPPAGIAGSIGVIEAIEDHTARDAAEGRRFTVITSGARKADGNPHNETQPEAVAATQAIVDRLAAEFFAMVEILRGVPAAEVQALEARLVVGADAVAVRLADRVATLDEILAEVSASAVVPETEGGKAEDVKDEELIAALKARAEGDGEDAAKARKALAALEGEPDGDEPKGDKEHKEPDGDEPKAAAARIAELEAKLETSKREALIGGRSDLSASVRTFLASQPLPVVEGYLKAHPAAKTPAAAAELGARPTVGNVSASSRDEFDDFLDMATGKISPEALVGFSKLSGQENQFFCRAMTPAQARARLALKGGDQ